MGPVKSVKVATDRDTGRANAWLCGDGAGRGQRASTDEWKGVHGLPHGGQGGRGAGQPTSTSRRRPRRRPCRPGGSSAGRGGFTPRSGGPRPWRRFRWLFVSGQKAFCQEEKVSRNKPDKYSDGPRQTKWRGQRRRRCRIGRISTTIIESLGLKMTFKNPPRRVFCCLTVSFCPSEKSGFHRRPRIIRR